MTLWPYLNKSYLLILSEKLGGDTQVIMATCPSYSFELMVSCLHHPYFSSCLPITLVIFKILEFMQKVN